MDYVMYASCKNKLYTILTDITRTPNKENVLANILFRVEELDDNNEDTKIVKELKDAYIYDAGLTDHQINDGIASMYTTSIKIDANVEDENEIKWHHMKSGAINELIRYVKESEEKVKEDEKKWPMIDDVIMPEETKREVTQMMRFIRKREKYEAIGARIPKNILLYGKPGTGKSMIAKAISNECNVHFMYRAGSEFARRYVGDSPKEIKKMFKEAREKAPTILFIDEIDALGKKRSEDTNGEDVKALTQLLTELDGFDTTDDVFLIGATNTLDLLDPALLRSGRFDKKVKILTPNGENRKAMFELYINKIKHEDNMDYELYSVRTLGLTGADISTIVNNAAISAVDDDRDKVSSEDILNEIDKILMFDDSENSLEKKKNAIGFI